MTDVTDVTDMSDGTLFPSVTARCPPPQEGVGINGSPVIIRKPSVTDVTDMTDVMDMTDGTLPQCNG